MSDNPYSQKALRSGVAAFLAGRAISAGLAFIAFSLAARLLPLAEYGKYASALALLELALALSSGGIEWVSARMVPERRIHAGGRVTALTVLRLSALQAALQVTAGLLVFLCAGWISALLQLPGTAPVFRLTGGLIALECLGRLSRDQMLGILMDQRSGQTAQVCRSGTLMAQLALAWFTGAAMDAQRMVGFELVAAGSAAVVGALLLARTLLRVYRLPAANPDWRAGPARAMVKLGLHNYASYLLALLYGPQVLTMLIARLMGADAVALYGFARSFADQVRRYLPTDLFQSIVRPALIAFYAAGNDFAALSVRLGLWLKMSLLLLFPLIVFFAACGPQGMRLLGGGRFVAAWPLVVVLLGAAGTLAWRRVLELACNTVLASDITVRATVVLVVMPPLIALLLWSTHVLLLAVLAALAAELVFCWRVLRSLARRGYVGHWDRRGCARLLAAALAAIALLVGLQQFIVLDGVAAVVVSGLVSLLAMRAAVPLSALEGALVAAWNSRVARWAGVQSEVML